MKKTLMILLASLTAAPAFAFNHIDCRLQVPNDLDLAFHDRLRDRGWRPIAERDVTETGQIVGLFFSHETKVIRSLNRTDNSDNHIPVYQYMIVIRDQNRETVASSTPQTWHRDKSRRVLKNMRDGFDTLDHCYIKSPANDAEAGRR